MVQQLLSVDTEMQPLLDPLSLTDMLLVVAMLQTLLELSMLPRERLKLMLMPSMVLMDIAVLAILVSDILAMVMLLLLSPMLPQLSLMATLLLLLPLLPMDMLPLLMVLLLLSVDTELL